MKPRDLFDFVLLAALWGASFLFMRVGAPEFGPVALIGLRVLIAALCLWPLLWLTERDTINAMQANSGRLAVVGLLNSALPFTLLAFASLSLTAGFNALINATVPFWVALIGAAFVGVTLAGRQWLGLAIGVVGMVILTWGKVDFKPDGSGVAIIAGLLATLSYGIVPHFAKRFLSGMPPLGMATGSQTAAALVLVPLTVLFWPAAMPSGQAWLALVLLGALSTALAYILYFRLLDSLGGQKGSLVTFLIPVFAVLWGWVFLGEAITATMLGGGAVVLFGTALTLGLASKLK